MCQDDRFARGICASHRCTIFNVYVVLQAWAGTPVSIPHGSPRPLAPSLGSANSREALFFRTGFARALRTSNCSNRIEATGFASRKERCWPPVPLLTSLLKRTLLPSVRRRRRDSL